MPPRRRKKPRPPRPLGPTPTRSEELYLELPPASVGMFRFLLEAHDNLALFTILDRHRATLRLVYAPGARPQIDRFLDSLTDHMTIRRWEF